MPILSPIGRRHPKVRLLLSGVYALLVLGAVTMIYPFLLMVSGSTKSAVDIHHADVFPRFFFDDLTLYRKHVEGLFNERVDMMEILYELDAGSFAAVMPPGEVNTALVDAWSRFLDETELPAYTYTLGYLRAHVSKTLPLMARRFKGEMLKRFDGDIDALNRELGTDFVNWNAFDVRPENYLPRHGSPRETPLTAALEVFKQGQPRAWHTCFSVEGFYRTLFLKPQYSRDIREYNRLHGTAHTSYADIRLTPRLPEGTPQERRDWEEFVRYTLNLLWVRVDGPAADTYRAFLKAKYGTLEALNRNYGSDYRRFEEVPMVDEPPAHGLPLSDWEAFIVGWKDPDTGTLYAPAADQLRVDDIAFRFRDALRNTYGSVRELNRRLGTQVADFDEVCPPQQAAHYQAFLGLRRALRWEFATRNYRTVVDYMLIHGRGILNTAIYCALAVLAALVVNPLAAYALSRYRPPSTYKLLLFMLITMAFPPMVTQIPVFLMLRDMHLLNTFAALVLPGLAHGYSIFLLKGFFDSLPRELYECAELDGAGQWTMFWHITMSLSKPILAVIALHAFTTAYANFMFALLICQDERMWTLMVWLYQLQQRSGQAVVYASLLIAAVPTLLIFLFCQNIIMRGIVVPVEK